MNKKILLLSLLAASLFSCSNDDDADSKPKNTTTTFGIRHDRVLSTHEAIAANKNPYNTEAHPDFSSVVAFSYQMDGVAYIASGTLIAKNWVLTAAHNFVTKTNGKVTEEVKPKNILVKTGSDFNNPTNTINVEQVVSHPVYLSNHKDAEEFDIALVKLATPITTITPARSSLDVSSIGLQLINNEIWSAGYGDYDVTSSDFSNIKRHAFNNILDDVLTYNAKPNIDSRNYRSFVYVMDFDNPSKSSNTINNKSHFITKSLNLKKESDATPLNFEGIIIEGDSGGPVFSKVDGKWTLVAVNAFEYEIENDRSFKKSNYGAISGHVALHAHKLWMVSTMKLKRR